jgi:YD repeat-containing protein
MKHQSVAPHHTYTYDSAQRLTSWAKPGSTAVTFGYDKAGNRTAAARTTFTHSDRNQVISSTDGTTYAYTKRVPHNLAGCLSNAGQKNSLRDLRANSHRRVIASQVCPAQRAV